jgi:uncharacterized repeat protein (TIGR01451 family)
MSRGFHALSSKALLVASDSADNRQTTRAWLASSARSRALRSEAVRERERDLDVRIPQLSDEASVLAWSTTMWNVSTARVFLVLTALFVMGRADMALAQGAMTNGQNHSGVLSAPGELDSWTIAATSGDSILVRMGEIGGDSELYPYLLLYAPNGTLVTYDSGAMVAQVSTRATQTGTYTVVARTADSGMDALGDYSLTLARPPGSPVVSGGDEGGPMANGANHAGNIHVGDLDQWTFTATSGSSMVVRIGEVGGDSELYPYLLLYGPNGALLTYDSGAVVAQVSAVAPQDGVYTVVATTADSGFDATGDYQITLALMREALSTQEDSGPLTNGLNHAAAIHVGDMDQWTFTAASGASIVVRMGEVGGDSELYPYLLLYGPNGALVTYSSGAVVTQVSAVAPQAGTYTVVATTADSGFDATGDYLITLALMAGPAPQVSPGDQGGALTNGLNLPGEIHTGDMDQWTFNVTSGSSIVARIGEVGGDSDLYPYLLLYAPNGSLVTYDSGAEVAQVSAVAGQTGTYTVVATTADSGYDASGDYLLTLALVPGTPQLSPGDQGGAMTNGRNHSGLIHTGDMDQWTFTATAGSSLIVRIGEVGGDSDLYPYLLLYGPNGALVTYDSGAVVAQVSAVAQQNGVYTVVATTADSGYNATGDYLITLALAPGSPELSAGDQGGAMTNGANHAGEIHVGDIDQWFFDATAGSSIVARIGEVGGDSDLYPYLLLYGPNGALITYDSGAVVASLSAVASQSGRYTLVAMTADSGYDAAGDYLLTLALVPGSPIVPTGDEGGGMAPAVAYAGAIHVGDLDQWRFGGTSGNSCTISVGETGGDSSFYPQVAMYGPTGALVTYDSGAVTAGFTRTISTSGVYTLVITTVDSGYDATGTYNVTMTGCVSPPTPPDVMITKAVSTSVAEPGAHLTYTLTVVNLSGVPGTSVVVSDTLPAGLSFVSCSAPGGVCGGSGNARTVSYSSLAAFSSATITLVTTVTAGAGATLTNTGVVASAGDPDVSNNTASALTQIRADSLPNDWETRFGLDPDSSDTDNSDGGDPDGDGRTNLEELGDGTHPRGFFVSYLAEGARNTFFDARLAVLNIGPRPGHLLFRFLQSNASVLAYSVPLPNNRRITIGNEVLAGLTSPDFSTVLESDEPIVLDRTMTWNGGRGSHAETGVPQPSTTWYLAEGATTADFSLFYLLQNPNPFATVATVKYLLPLGQAPITMSYPLAANSRTTIPVDAQGAILASTDVSAVITTPAGAPIIVERAMYRSTPTQAFAAGHGSTGVTETAVSWFLAEGATGPFFDCFILLANPGPTPANVTINYLLSDGRTFTKSYAVPAEGRYSVWVDNEEIPGGSGVRPLENVAVSSTVTSDVPIIVERTMWWPGPGMAAEFWTEAHNSPGATVTGTRWALAEGEVGGDQAADTYILIANTSATAGNARVTLYFADGTSATQTFALLPRSRRNVNVSGDFPNRPTTTFSAVIDSLPGSGAPAAQIVVERAMYTSPGGAIWEAGTNALATRLSP